MLPRRSRIAFAALAAIAAVSAACHFQPSPVPIVGSSADIARLAGAWDGEYSSTESGRTGTISFMIKAGKDSAFGDVLMVPSTGARMYAADAMTQVHQLHSPSPELLRIEFVSVEAGIVRGELEAYLAPDCRCSVTTVFRGALDGDKIDGTYVTRGRDLQQEGRWSVTRRTTAADGKTLSR